MTSSRGLEFLDKAALWGGKNDFSTTLPSTLLKLLGNPQDQIQCIHVAGTNGKGSVCAILAAIFYAAGNRVGQFTSPHLTEVFERCLINGQTADKSSFTKSLDLMLDSAKEAKLEPSYFEAVAIASFLTFAQEKVDWGMIEVGLGGRLDATNTIKKAAATVITSIGYDHMHVLGESLSEIAKEKLGILRPSVPLFIGSQIDSEVHRVILEATKKIKAPCYFLDEQIGSKEFSELDQINFSLLSMLGKHQQANARLAALVALYLGIKRADIEQGLQTVSWPGRLEKISIPSQKNTDIILDAAHNIDGIKALSAFLTDYFSRCKVSSKPILIFGFLERKNWQQMLDRLKLWEQEFSEQSNQTPEWFFSSFDKNQSVDPKNIIDYFGKGTPCSTPREALAKALRRAQQEKSTLVAAGSIFFISEIRKLLVEESFSTIKK